MSEPQKHHYIPVFYLKRWTGADARLCEYSRPYREVKPRRTHPDGTGYVRGLYTVPGLPPELAQSVEKRFMRTTDDLAANALRVLLEGRDLDLNVIVKSGWSRFILSLMLRNPEFISHIQIQLRAGIAGTVEELRPTYLAWKRPEDPPTFDEFLSRMGPNPLGRAGAIFLQNIIDHQRLGAFINGMYWRIYRLEKPRHRLLTSDRPVVTSNGIGHEHSFILLPASPVHVFLAANTEEVCHRVESLLDARRLEQFLNNAVAVQAQRYVYGEDDRQLRFVENRLQRNPSGGHTRMVWTL